MDFYESLKLGGEISSNLYKLSKTKQLTLDYTFSNLKSLPTSNQYLDIENSGSYLIAPSSTKDKFSIYKHSYTQLEPLSSLGISRTTQATWLSWDPSLCFSIDNNKAIMWDSNTTKPLTFFPKLNKSVTPHIKANSWLLLSSNSKTKIYDFLSNDLIDKTRYSYRLAKWSPYRDEYFLSVGGHECFLWDMRRIRSPVLSIGYSFSKTEYKKLRIETAENAYDNFHLSENKKKMPDEIFDFSFSDDGRWAFIGTGIGVFKMDLLRSEQEMECIIGEEGRLVKCSDLGVFVCNGKEVGRFDDYYERVQSISLNNKAVMIGEIKNEEIFYMIDARSEIYRFCV